MNTPDIRLAYPLPPLGQRVVKIELPDSDFLVYGIHHGLVVDERGDTMAVVNVDGENMLRVIHFSRVRLAMNSLAGLVKK